jgi:hypothetical protein
MFQMDVVMVLLDPSLGGMPGLTYVDLNTFARHAIHARSLESLVVLHRPKVTKNLLSG